MVGGSIQKQFERNNDFQDCEIWTISSTPTLLNYDYEVSITHKSIIYGYIIPMLDIGQQMQTEQKLRKVFYWKFTDFGVSLQACVFNFSISKWIGSLKTLKTSC